MMQIPEFGVSGAEMYGTKPPNIDLPVPKFWTSGATDGGAEEIADLKAPYTPQIGTFWHKCLIQIPENCHFATPEFWALWYETSMRIFRGPGSLKLLLEMKRETRFGNVTCKRE
jgi:hypothetical protein